MDSQAVTVLAAVNKPLQTLMNVCICIRKWKSLGIRVEPQKCELISTLSEGQRVSACSVLLTRSVYLLKMVPDIYGIYPSSSIVRKYSRFSFSFQNFHTVFHRGCIILHSHQQRMKGFYIPTSMLTLTIQFLDLSHLLKSQKSLNFFCLIVIVLNYPPEFESKTYF